jgi:hypothetical protein
MVNKEYTNMCELKVTESAERNKNIATARELNVDEFMIRTETPTASLIKIGIFQLKILKLI